MEYGIHHHHIAVMLLSISAYYSHAAVGFHLLPHNMILNDLLVIPLQPSGYQILCGFEPCCVILLVVLLPTEPGPNRTEPGDGGESRPPPPPLVSHAHVWGGGVGLLNGQEVRERGHPPAGVPLPLQPTRVRAV